MFSLSFYLSSWSIILSFLAKSCQSLTSKVVSKMFFVFVIVLAELNAEAQSKTFKKSPDKPAQSVLRPHNPTKGLLLMKCLLCQQTPRSYFISLKTPISVFPDFPHSPISIKFSTSEFSTSERNLIFSRGYFPEQCRRWTWHHFQCKTYRVLFLTRPL